MKRCSACGVTKPRECFYRRNKNSNWVSAECIECKRHRTQSPAYSDRRRAIASSPEERAKQRARNHSPEAKRRRDAYHRTDVAKEKAKKRAQTDHYKRVRRNRQIMKKYGISISDYEAMLASQGGRCALCPSTDPGGILSFHIDHDHATGKVRGLLCLPCNTMLGHAGDSPTHLRAAADYIELHRVTGCT